MSHLSAKQAAERLGISVKALRVYETRGLIQPSRSAAGWRRYGDGELRTLHKVLTLKSLGFGLSEISALLADDVSLDAVLDAQAAGLQQRLDRVLFAMRVLQTAQTKLARRGALAVDDLIQLTQETIMTTTEWTDAHDALARRHFDDQQMDVLAQRKLSPELQATLFSRWQALVEEAEGLRAGASDSPEALDFARRWTEVASEFSGGDADMERALATWYEEGFADDERAALMPFSREVWMFVSAAVSHLPDGHV